MFGEADVTAAKLPFLLLRLSGVRCCEEPPASITFGGSSSMPLAHSEELRNTSSAALTVFAAETAIPHLFLEKSSVCLLDHSEDFGRILDCLDILTFFCGLLKFMIML